MSSLELGFWIAALSLGVVAVVLAIVGAKWIKRMQGGWVTFVVGAGLVVGAVLYGVYQVNLTLTVGVGGFILGVIAYWMTLSFGNRRRISAMSPRALVEKFWCFISGGFRFKVLSEFADYCSLCKSLVIQAARRRSPGVLHTVQTPVDVSSLSDTDKRAYQDYLATTNQVLFSKGFGYNRFVYLPPPFSDVNADALCVQNLSRAYDFVRTSLYEYFLTSAACPDPSDTIAELVHTPPPEYNVVYPSIGNSGLEELRASWLAGDPPLIGGVGVAFAARVGGLLDVCSRLDVHLPAGQEFTLAFSRPIDPYTKVVGLTDGTDKDFVGCLLVCDPIGAKRPRRHERQGERPRSLHDGIKYVFEHEWVRLRVISSVVDFSEVAKAFKNRMIMPVYLSEPPAPDHVGEFWKDKMCDKFIFDWLCLCAYNALYDYFRSQSNGSEIQSIPISTHLTRFREAGVEAVNRSTFTNNGFSLSLTEEEKSRWNSYAERIAAGERGNPDWLIATWGN